MAVIETHRTVPSYFAQGFSVVKLYLDQEPKPLWPRITTLPMRGILVPCGLARIVRLKFLAHPPILKTKGGYRMLSTNQLSRITKELILNLAPTNSTPEAIEAREAIAKDLAQMRKDGTMPDLPYDPFDDDDLLPAASPTAPDYSEPLNLAPEGLSIQKILAVLSADERLWLGRMIEANGEEEFLRMWPSYEVQINFVRIL